MKNLQLNQKNTTVSVESTKVRNIGLRVSIMQALRDEENYEARSLERLNSDVFQSFCNDLDAELKISNTPLRDGAKKWQELIGQARLTQAQKLEDEVGLMVDTLHAKFAWFYDTKANAEDFQTFCTQLKDQILFDMGIIYPDGEGFLSGLWVIA